MDDVKSLAYRLFDLLNAYIVVHDDMLGRKPAGYLEPIDFAANASKLGQIYSAIQQLRAEGLALQKSSGCPSQYVQYLTTMHRYVDALLDTVDRLRKVAEKLDRKAQGKKYDLADYQLDMRLYKASVDRYTKLGDALKRAWEAAGL